MTEMSHELIGRIYAAHGIELEYVETAEGPQVQRHLFRIPIGVKVGKALALVPEVEMGLGIEGVAISRQGLFVAVDVPREVRQFVDWQPLHTTGLEFFAGLDLAGKVTTVDLAKAPHLLIAGSTGSGKSVAINSILTDWLSRLDHTQIRLHIIDPKRVELGQYKDFPQVEQFASGAGHDADLVINILESVMDERFIAFEEAGVRDIGEYRAAHPEAHMPWQVLVVDEFADLMLGVAAKEIEKAIIRISQLGRAAGVHMLLATQRPSMKVFTGLIKGNVPGRWVFRVNSQTDSRIALDEMGAEDLLGAGDSLLQLPGAKSVLRVQSAATSPEQFNEVAEWAASTWPDMDYPPPSSLNEFDPEDTPDDDALIEDDEDDEDAEEPEEDTSESDEVFNQMMEDMIRSDKEMPEWLIEKRIAELREN